MTNDLPPPKRVPPRFRLVRTIIVLLILLAILLFLIWHYGLGSGGGRILPGSGDASAPEAATTPSALDVAAPRPAPEADEPEVAKPTVRRELTVSFYPSPTDPDSAVALRCRLDWVDARTGKEEFRELAADQMADFEFALEKEIRAWRLSLQSTATTDVPVLAVRMSPFPGEGVFRKIETLARQTDARINLLRLETPASPSAVP